MKRPSWYGYAMATIVTARSEGERLGLAGAELLAHVDASYPFGPRRYHPYRQWLKARRMHCWDLPGVRPPKSGPSPDRRDPMPGQLDLFDSHQETQR